MSVSLGTPFHQLLPDKLRLLSLRRVLLDEIGEEEEFEDDKHDEELHKDDRPERAPQRHVPEPVVIQVKDFVQESCLSHVFPVRRVFYNYWPKIRKKIHYYTVFPEKNVKCEQFIFFNENVFAKKSQKA